jgi:RNA polymerase sigma-70 factor (ECF subfamily)
MSKRDKETTMGGAKGSFETTRWTQIQKAKTRDQERREASVNNLLARYWKPVYCYLRHKGHSNEDAKDLTQGFFHEIVLGRELIQQADQAKGRFRTFLLTALDRYVTSVYRKETAKKRLPAQGLAQLEDAELPGLQLGESKTTPELAFYYTWATSLLDEVLAKVRDEYWSTGRATYWEVFQATVVAPIFDNTEAPSLTELCDKLGIESEKRASNMAITVKRRFATAIRNHLRQLVGSDSEIDDEFRALVEILSEGGAA